MPEPDQTDPSTLPSPTSGIRRVGYVLKQYPRLSETFVLNEILGVERAGIDVSVFSLRHATEGRFHPGVAEVRGTVHYPTGPDRDSALDTLHALHTLGSHRLPEVFEFLDLLPAERRGRLVAQAVQIAGRVVDDEIDHLHAHFLTVAAHTTHLVHLLTGVPYTVTAHAKDIYRHSVDWGIAARIAESAVAVVTVCDANLTYLSHRLDGAEVDLVRVYNGLGPQEPPTPLDERVPGLVLGVGRLVEKKGFDLLIRAIASLDREEAPIRAVIVGDGEARDALVALTRNLGLEDRVTFVGAQGQREVATWMRRAHVLAAPCRVGTDGNQDALPTVLLEALGAGLPAISTPVAGIPEIVGHDQEGLLVPCDDVAALTAAIRRIVGDEAGWRRLSAAGPTKLARHFDRDRTIHQLIERFGVTPTAATR